nr:alpha/beta fold hydrolase [Micromonospora sp. DSM 115978]
MNGSTGPTSPVGRVPSPVPHCRLDGPAGAPLLVLGPSLGTTLQLWDEVVGRLSRSRRVLRFDLPGHGNSPAPPAGCALTVADLAASVLALVDAVDGGAYRGEPFAYAGVSLGGAVGVVLAATRPVRVSALVLVCSSARFGEPSGWHDRAASARERGTKTLLEAAGQRWFSPSTESSAERRQALLDDLAATDDQGYAACCLALAAYDQRSELRHVTAPTLV